MIHEKLIAELERDEGMRLKPYRDSLGIETIGIGRNLRDVGLSKEEAYHLCNNDLDRVFAGLDELLPWWRSLNEVRQRAVANLAFNMGVVRLFGFRKTLALLEAGDYESASVEVLASKWAQQVGERAGRISRMIRDGIE